MALKELKGQGHWPTLLACFLYFDFSFMVWTMMGPLATEIAESLKSNSKFYYECRPKCNISCCSCFSWSYSKSCIRIFVDKVGAKKTALTSQFIVVVGLFYAYYKGETITYNELLAVAFIFRFCWWFFAVALPQAGQWYPPKLQGVVLDLQVLEILEL